MHDSRSITHLPLVVAILDGWGIAPKSPGNAIAQARTPNMNRFCARYPYTELTASGAAVGLPHGQDGNSEAGHLNIGAGRIIEQDSVVISRSIADGTFYKNPALLAAIHHATRHTSRMHVMGLLTNHNSAHANPDHLYALLDFLHVKYGKPVYLHLFTDGRDTPPNSSARFLDKLARHLHDDDVICTISGRFYAMDRVKNWDRTMRAYEAMVLANGRVADNPLRAILESYSRGDTDEFIEPTVIANPKRKSKFISDNDSIIFFNLRSDRARQITKPFVQERFEREGFKRRKRLHNILFTAFTDFGADLDSVSTAFPPQVFRNTLPFALDGLRQLYVAEREKFAHVTYFFAGGSLPHSPLIEHRIVKSGHPRSFDEQPRMSLQAIERSVLQALTRDTHDVIVLNVANPDMVAHTGNLRATVRAAEYVDKFLGTLERAIRGRKGTLVVTADHGNAEELINLRTGEVDTEHSNNPVPFTIVTPDATIRRVRLRSGGKLSDIAPTILKLLSLPKPKEMTGKSLF